MQIMVFPARAGVILMLTASPLPIVRLSRTSGGDPGNETLLKRKVKSFPHERG